MNVSAVRNAENHHLDKTVVAVENALKVRYPRVDVCCFEYSDSDSYRCFFISVSRVLVPCRVLVDNDCT